MTLAYFIITIALTKPYWLKTNQVEDIYSVSNCTSDNFTDYITFWKHNGYWFFNSVEDIIRLAKENNISLENTKFFYYEVYEFQCYEDDPTWETFEPEKTFKTHVVAPNSKVLEGYDIVTFNVGTAPECSYLSCNHMAQEIKVNSHCLLDSFEDAKSLLATKVFKDCEPGPCRIFTVYSLPQHE